MGFSNPTSKTGNFPSVANHHLTRTRCLCPKGETSGLERGNPARTGGPDLSLWQGGGDRRDDAYRRNTWRTLGILQRVSGRAQKKTPRSRISLPWGSSGVRLTVFEKETETRQNSGNLSGSDSHGWVRLHQETLIEVMRREVGKDAVKWKDLPVIPIKSSVSSELAIRSA